MSEQLTRYSYSYALSEEGDLMPDASGDWVRYEDAAKLIAEIVTAMPPCGTDGDTLAALVIRDLCESEPENPDDPDTLCVKVNYVAEVIQRHAKPAAPVAPATVAVPDLSSEPYRSRALVAMQKVYVGNPRCNLYTMADMLDAALAASQREGGAT